MLKDGHSDDFVIKAKSLRTPKYPVGLVKKRPGAGVLNVFQNYKLSDIQREKVKRDKLKLGDR